MRSAVWRVDGVAFASAVRVALVKVDGCSIEIEIEDNLTILDAVGARARPSRRSVTAHMGCEPKRLTGYAPIDEARERFERRWEAPIPSSPGLDLIEMIDAAEQGRLRALWAIGYDILLTNPNAERTRRALAKLELVIVQDLFLNETARELAHVFLPAASSFEKDGTFMNAERRVQRVRAAIAPHAQSRPRASSPTPT